MLRLRLKSPLERLKKRMKMKRKLIITALLLLMFGITNNLFAQIVYACPLLSFNVQGERRGKEAAEKCVMELHENGNINVYILEKWADSCDYLDYAYYTNNDNIYAKYQFRSRNRDFEPEYTLFSEIIINGVGLARGEFYCRMKESIVQPHGSLMLFNLFNEGTDDYIISQIFFFRPEPDSRLEFKVEYD